MEIISGVTNKVGSSTRLKSKLEDFDLEGLLYIGYPILGTIEGAFPIDALLITKEHGVVVIDLFEGKSGNTNRFEDNQDRAYTKMEIKLKDYKGLIKKRELCVEINTLTYAPLFSDEDTNNEEYPVCNDNNLIEVIQGFKWNTPEYYESTLSALQAISTIRKRSKKREIKKLDSKGAKLEKLENAIANLDNMQNKAVIETVMGVQRIRGLAGSGKTIVLALKAAYLHAQHPEWNIAVTFNSRSLKEQLKSLITTFCMEQTKEEPDWDKIEIIHAWGAPGKKDNNGMYYTFCAVNNIEYYDYSGAKDKYGKFGYDQIFGKICEEAINSIQKSEEIYDAILVDEAQDFTSDFLKICYHLLKEPKQLVYAYDELQNLSSMSLPSPEDLFGKDEKGNPLVVFTNVNQDIILDKCYRNSRPVLVTAHALGFGIYRDIDESIGTGIVQMFEQKSLWEEIGYILKSGNLEDGKNVVLSRTEDTSPRFLEDHSDKEDLINFVSFNNKGEQDAWIADQIIKNLEEDELEYSDIIVINPNPLTTKKNVSNIRSILYSKGVASHTTGVDISPDVVFTHDSIAFSGIYRAKGNEAAMVYVINSHESYHSYENIANIRNRLFTAITRSKAWVRVVGYGDEMDSLIDEFEKVKENKYELNFTYPTEEQLKYMKIVNRDLSSTEKAKIISKKKTIEELLNEIKNGNIYFEDLGIENIEELLNMYKSRDSDET
ncbi:MAG TPA: ATP-binding domain-containing protein [Gallicola sp.]|nr:ATP-binding domain-containing protein [Gallicola sp.]